MVTIKSYQQRKTSTGKVFLVLELEGGMEIVQSLSTGRPYATTKRCTIPCTFDEDIAEKMVGSHLDGEIIRVPCEPYTYVSPKTQETLTLDYQYSYKAPECGIIEPKTLVKNVEVI